jgi:hypothetical protein
MVSLDYLADQIDQIERYKDIPSLVNDSLYRIASHLGLELNTEGTITPKTREILNIYIDTFRKNYPALIDSYRERNKNLPTINPVLLD